MTDTSNVNGPDANPVLCAECGQPIGPLELGFVETCWRCERDYQQDSSSDDDYPHAA